MSGLHPSDVFVGDLHVFRCDTCGARREVAAHADAPSCGHLTSDVSRFPDGGWVRVEQWVVHGLMRATGVVVDGDPLGLNKVEESGDA